MRPLISILTPCLNRREFIQEAIQSVQRQEYASVEHIVVDGGSTDGTLELLRAHPHLRVISEPDGGVYEALNKAIRAAHGEIIGHLNSDDLYAPNVLGEVARRFQADAELDGVCGGAIVFEEDRVNGRRTPVAEHGGPARDLSFETIILGIPIINARFFRRRVYERLGLYDCRYAMAADRDFLMRVALAGTTAAGLDRVVYQYRQHAGSLTISGNSARRLQMLAEHVVLAESYLALPGLPAEARRCCRQSHSQASLDLLKAALAARRAPDALRYLLRGWRRNARWPRLVAAGLAPEWVHMQARWWRARLGVTR